MCLSLSGHWVRGGGHPGQSITETQDKQPYTHSHLRAIQTEQHQHLLWNVPPADTSTGLHYSVFNMLLLHRPMAVSMNPISGASDAILISCPGFFFCPGQSEQISSLLMTEQHVLSSGAGEGWEKWKSCFFENFEKANIHGFQVFKCPLVYFCVFPPF